MIVEFSMVMTVDKLLIKSWKIHRSVWQRTI